jgi:hypothetical protein
MQTCRLFYDVILEVAQLHYRLELGTLGMVDNPRCKMTLGEKYSRLLQYRDGWNKIDCSTSQSSPHLYVDQRQGLRIVDGIHTSMRLQQTEGGPSRLVTLTQLPRAARGIKHTSWTISHPVIRGRLIEFSPKQDLLVILELVDGMGAMLHTLTLSTTKPHPQAHGGPIRWSLSYLMGSTDLSMLLSGDWVAIRTAFYSFPSSSLVVFNWKTGLTVFVS